MTFSFWIVNLKPTSSMASPVAYEGYNKRHAFMWSTDLNFILCYKTSTSLCIIGAYCICIHQYEYQYKV